MDKGPSAMGSGFGSVNDMYRELEVDHQIL